MQFVIYPALDPKRYVSPSREYVLYVDPSDRDGSGPATYRVTKGSHPVWEGTRPFTLRNAAIADDGTIGGYAFTKGISALGEFLVVILDPEGKIRGEERVPRESSRYADGPNTPFARGLFLDATNDRFVVRMADTDLNRNVEAWWIYSLATGKARPRFTPDQPPAQKGPYPTVLTINDVKPVTGTPLTLLCYVRLRYREPMEYGAVFSLIDLDGQPVWQLVLPKDYHVPGDEKMRDRLRRVIGERGVILRTDQPHSFTLWHVAAQQQVTYTIKPGTNDVYEIGRAPLAVTLPPTLTFTGPRIVLHPRTGAAALPRNPALDPRVQQRAERIQRRPDGTWLTPKAVCALAPDGTLAVLDPRIGDPTAVVCFYRSDNTPLRLFPLPKALAYSRLAYDGTRVILVNQQSVFCYHANGKPWWRCELPRTGGPAVIWIPLITESGRTLCLTDGAHTVVRYTMPA